MIIPLPCRLTLAAGAVILITACERQSVQSYTVPKEAPPAQSAAAAGDDAPATPPRRELPQMAWSLPAGWKQVEPGQMSAASFAVTTDKGEATVTITPLPNLAGREEMVVNMWRQQVGQEPLSPDQISKALSEVEVGGQKGLLFEIDGDRDGKALRIITAIQHGRADSSWFYKMSGDANVVAEQKPAFLEFVKSIRFKDDAPGAATAAAAPVPLPAPASVPSTAPAGTQEPSSFKWTVPPSWQEVPAGQMQAAKFSVPEKEGAKAEVAVSIFPSDTGGILANLNRWRGQLGQPPVAESEVGQFVKPLEGGPEGAQLVELPGEDKRIIGAIVPREGRWWFYKMTGGAPAVNAARDEFVAFAKAQP